MPVADSPHIKKLGLVSAGLYALLLLPTIHLLTISGFADTEISRLIESAWHPDFFESLAILPKAMGQIIVHGLLFSGIAGMAWVYYSAGKIWPPKNKEENKENKKAPVPIEQILFWTMIFSLILLLVIPFHSKDIYGYINRGAEQAFYSLNPYMHPLADVPNWQENPLFHEHWVDNPSPYGFFFTRFTQRLCNFAGDSFSFAFILFKFSSVLLHLGATYLIYLLGCRLNLSRPEFGAFLYGWNPLMLLQIVGNGHNDLWVSLGILLAISMLRLPSWRWTVFPLLCCSIFTKYASILVVPFLLIAFIKWREWKALSIGITVALAITIALGWPYLQDWQNLPFDAMAKNAGMTQHSLNSMLSRLVYYLGNFAGFSLSIESLRSVFKSVIWLGFAVFFAYQSLQFWRHFKAKDKTKDKAHGPNYQVLIQPMALVLLVMISMASSKFHAWYIAMFFPLIFLLDENAWPRRFGLLLSYFQLLAFTPLQNIHILNYLLLTIVPLVLSLKNTPFKKRLKEILNLG